MSKSIAIAAAAVMALSIAHSNAAPAYPLVQQTFTPLPDGTRAGLRPAGYFPECGYGAHYACWYGVFGGRHCRCWVGGDHPACPSGYRFSCGYGPYDRNDCACY